MALGGIFVVLGGTRVGQVSSKRVGIQWRHRRRTCRTGRSSYEQQRDAVQYRGPRQRHDDRRTLRR